MNVTADTHLPQTLKLFRVYNLYRIIISIVLTGLVFIDPSHLDQPIRLQGQYQITVTGYLILNLLIGALLLGGAKPGHRYISASVLADIVIMHLLLALSTGITNGIANLIIISVAAGNILTPSRLGIFYAALAAICSLALAGWYTQVLDSSPDDIMRAGSLGILYFGAALILQWITRRLQRSEALADSRARSLLEMEKINQQIIQRMRTGILVADDQGRLRLANAAAEELLFGRRARTDGDLSGQSLPPQVLDALSAWQANPRQRSLTLQVSGDAPMLQVSFTRLDETSNGLSLIFIEDLSRVTQQAQQMKLASLGRLTAGIAHEIRNPLGAISHAAQLMQESGDLPLADQKMLDIIHRHSRRVNGIIENILDLSRRREARAELIELPVWLAAFINDYCQSAARGTEPAPEIELKVSGAVPDARFDVSQIEQVLTNLCDNGLRYSLQKCGTPKLTLRVGASADGERAYIDIQDEGPGIPEQYRLNIFEPFFTTDKKGTGLGLYLARELCESNQAHLSLLENDHPGCCFRITFAPAGRLI